MLQALERKLAAVVADAVADRAHIEVTVAAGPAALPDAGTAIARVAVASAAPDRGFDRERTAFAREGAATTGRRVLPVRFEARIAFVVAPDTGAGAVADARSRLLEDVSVVAHALDELSVRDGTALGSAGDAGYEVQCFSVAAAALEPDPAVETDDGRLRGELTCDGRATIWPPGSAGPRGVTRAVDVTLAALPLELSVDAPRVATGGSTRVRVRGVAGRRLIDPTGGREPIRLAARVTSDLPADQRGQISGGEAATAGGYRIIPVGEPETVLTYDAPSGDLGAVRSEQIEIRLATREGGPGVALGTIAIELEPAP